MSTEQNQRRASALKLADAVNMIEGVPVSDYARHLSVKWAQGKISGEQMREALLLSHKQIAARQVVRHD